MFTNTAFKLGSEHVGGKPSVSHSLSKRPPAVQLQRLKLRRALLSDSLSPHQAAIANHIFQQSARAWAEQTTWLNVTQWVL